MSWLKVAWMTANQSRKTGWPRWSCYAALCSETLANSLAFILIYGTDPKINKRASWGLHVFLGNKNSNWNMFYIYFIEYSKCLFVWMLPRQSQRTKADPRQTKSHSVWFGKRLVHSEGNQSAWPNPKKGDKNSEIRLKKQEDDCWNADTAPGDLAPKGEGDNETQAWTITTVANWTGRGETKSTLPK